jgi:hypothetical protein
LQAYNESVANKDKTKTEDEKKRNKILNEMLKRNDNKHLNLFGRK